MNAPIDPASRTRALADLLREGRAAAVIAVRGDSMLPTLASERRVAVRFGDAPPRFGDLVVFRQAGYLAVHRCVGRGRAAGRPHLRTRGDGRTDCDGPVDLIDVLGVVSALERGDGWRATAGVLARTYAVLVAALARFWAESGALASSLDRRSGGQAFRSFVETADRLSLRLADTMFFRAAHRRVEEPAAAAKVLESALLY